MRIVLFTFLTLLSTNCFGQQLHKYQVDSTMTVSIPDGYTISDTMGMKVITSQFDYGLIMVMVMPNKGKTEINVQDEEGLIKAYKGFVTGAVNAQKGQLIKQEIIEKNGLKCMRFSFKAAMGSEKQIRHSLAIFVNNNIYALNFWKLESMTNEVEDEIADLRERFFASLILPTNLTIKDQLNGTYEDSIKDDRAYVLGELIGYGFMLALLILGIVWISKKV